MITAFEILNYYDGATEFVGEYKTEEMKYPELVLGWWHDDGTDEQYRVFDVWVSRIDEALDKRIMEHLGYFEYDEIEWDEAAARLRRTWGLDKTEQSDPE